MQVINNVLKWGKLHKKATVIIILALFIIGLAGGGNSSKTSSKPVTAKTASAIPATKATSTPKAQTLKFSVQVAEISDNASGTNIIDLINPADVNETNMRLLCNNLHQTAVNGKKYYHADIYDNQKAIDDRDIVIKDQGTDTQNSNYDSHYIVTYNYNPGHDDHCAITLNGIDSAQIDVSY